MRGSKRTLIITFWFVTICVKAQATIKVIELSSSTTLGVNLPDIEERSESFVIGTSATASTAAAPGRPIPITTSNGTKYTCYVPTADGDAQRRSAADRFSPADQADEYKHEKTPGEILDALGEWCTYRVEDWWTYEVCYKKAVRQYHTEAGKVTDQFHLGNFSATESEMSAPLTDSAAAGGPLRYVLQRYTGGEKCELTGGNRSAEVRFVCGKGTQALLEDVREPVSCSYVFTVSTPRLCKHFAFQDAPVPVTLIKCYPNVEGGRVESRSVQSCAAADLSEGSCNVQASDEPTILAIRDEVVDDGGLAVAAKIGGVEDSSHKAARNDTSVLHELDGEEDEDLADGVGLNDLFNEREDDYYDENY